MRKIVLALAALAAFGLAIPAASTPAEARDVVIIKKKHHWRHHYNRGHHYGWYKHRRHHHHRGARIVIR
jgi:hypothetical protein